MTARPSRVLVFGISGATWDVARPLLDAGRLPNLRALIEQGCAGTMHSVRVPGDKHYRPQVAWVSVATGCLPSHHGVTTFYQTADDCRCPTLWDIFHAAGRRSGLFAWPITWPPKPIDGFMIPCYHARDESTWPPELTSIRRIDRQQHEARHGREARPVPRAVELFDVLRILQKNGLRLRVAPTLAACTARSLLGRSPEVRGLGLRHGKAEIMAELFLHLYRRWQPHLGSFHSSIVDNVSHRYWLFRDPAGFGLGPEPVHPRLASAVDDAYARTDRVLGRILKDVTRDTLVAVVSEHGMAPEYATNEAGEFQYLIRGARLAELVGLESTLREIPIARWIAYRPFGNGPVPPDALERFRSVKVVETGLSLFNVYLHGTDEIIVKFAIPKSVPRYHAGNLEGLRVTFGGRVVPFGAVAKRVGRRRSAMHDARGIVVFSGPGIRRGVQLPDSQITDFAPTILQAARLEPPVPMDGRVLDVFQSGR